MSINKLVIDRSLWGMRALLRDDGKMCCLGHLSLACGVPKTEMKLGFPLISWIKEYDMPKFIDSGRYADGSPIREMTSINDSQNLTQAVKEERLIELFGMNGIELSFTGEGKLTV